MEDPALRVPDPLLGFVQNAEELGSGTNQGTEVEVGETVYPAGLLLLRECCLRAKLGLQPEHPTGVALLEHQPAAVRPIWRRQISYYPLHGLPLAGNPVHAIWRHRLRFEPPHRQKPETVAEKENQNADSAGTIAPTGEH